jgi:hypothetical protein
MIVRGLRLGGVALIALAPSPLLAARTRVTPYLEVQQVIDADLGGNIDRGVNAYTSVAAGVQANVDTRNAQATIDYRYEHRFGWNDDYGAQNVHTGLARGQIGLVPQLVTLEGGLLASRARTDIRGPAPTLLLGDQANISQVYGGYVGPTLATRLGDLDIAASYRFGYVRVENSSGFALAPGQPSLDIYDSSYSHTLGGSIGMKPGPLPFGWTISGGYEREDVNQLDQRYEGKFVRADATLPLTPTFALVGGVGYEKIVSSLRAPLIENGLPVVDRRGRYRTDPNSARLLAYDTDGMIYDGGVLWRPGRHTMLTARVGHRYGGTIYTGSFDWQIDGSSGLRVGVYDQIDSFGRGLTRGLSALPTQFVVGRNPFGNQLTGCVFGTTPGEGGCLDNVFQSITTSNYRSRGMYALYSARRGPWNVGAGAGYTQRTYLAPRFATLFSLDGVKDESWSAQANLGRRLDAASGIDFATYADLYESGIAGASTVKSGGATTSYYRSFGRHLSANAAVGVYAYDTQQIEAEVSGTLLLGMRYVF